MKWAHFSEFIPASRMSWLPYAFKNKNKIGARDMSATAASLEVGFEEQTHETTSTKAPKQHGIHTSKGRISALAFCTWSLMALLLIVASVLVMYASVIASSEDSSNIGGIQIGLMLLSLVALFYAIWLSVVISLKRLHDIGHSSWLYLVFLLPVVGTFFYLYIALKRGDAEDNRFGASIPATSFEKYTGIVGFIVIALLMAASLVDTIATIAKIA